MPSHADRGEIRRGKAPGGGRPGRRTLALGGAILAAAVAAPAARAIPVLQLYAEGATYNPVTESWVISATSSPVRVWVIANIDGPGGKGPVHDAELIVSFDTAAAPGGTVTMKGSQAGGAGSFTVGGDTYTDPSIPSDLSFGPSDFLTGPGTFTNPQTGVEESHPQMFSHQDGVVGGSDRTYVRLGLGDLDTPDSPVADFIDGTSSFTPGDKAQINVYELPVGGSFSDWHFDVVGWVDTDNDNVGDFFKFAPFSHDLDGAFVPEPGPLGLWSVGLLAALLVGRRRAGSRTRLPGAP